MGENWCISECTKGIGVIRTFLKGKGGGIERKGGLAGPVHITSPRFAIALGAALVSPAFQIFFLFGRILSISLRAFGEA